jgi:hypothetical protein
MFGFELDDVTGEELVRFVRALGKHRYVDGRLHVVHAFAVEAAHAATADPALDDAAAWASRVVSGPIDLATKDERLFRKVTDPELVAVLDAFWSAGERRSVAHDKLRARLASIEVDLEAECSRLPFDEDREDDVFPILVDAGWELVAIARFDRERHRGAIDAFGDEVGYQGAKFDEENAIPPLVHRRRDRKAAGSFRPLAGRERDVSRLLAARRHAGGQARVTLADRRSLTDRRSSS